MTARAVVGIYELEMNCTSALVDPSLGLEWMDSPQAALSRNASASILAADVVLFCFRPSDRPFDSLPLLALTYPRDRACGKSIPAKQAYRLLCFWCCCYLLFSHDASAQLLVGVSLHTKRRPLVDTRDSTMVICFDNRRLIRGP